MAGIPYALNYLAPQARDAARDAAAQLADYEEARREDRDAENRWERWAGGWDLED